MNAVNKALSTMSTDRIKDKLSYSDSYQQITLHMTSKTKFHISSETAMGTILGLQTPIVSIHIQPMVHNKIIKPSASVYNKPPVDDYVFDIEGNSVVDMNQGFAIMYIYRDVVESRVVGASHTPLLRCVPVYRLHGSIISQSFDHVQYMPLLYKRVRDDRDRYKRRYRATRAMPD